MVVLVSVKIRRGDGFGSAGGPSWDNLINSLIQRLEILAARVGSIGCLSIEGILKRNKIEIDLADGEIRPKVARNSDLK